MQKLCLPVFVIFPPPRSSAKEEKAVLKSGDLMVFAQSLLPIHWQLHNKRHLLHAGLGCMAIVSHCWQNGADATLTPCIVLQLRISLPSAAVAPLTQRHWTTPEVRFFFFFLANPNVTSQRLLAHFIIFMCIWMPRRPRAKLFPRIFFFFCSLTAHWGFPPWEKLCTRPHPCTVHCYSHKGNSVFAV